MRKNKTSEDFLLNTYQSQYFPEYQSQYFHAEIWKISLENMEDKILGFQFEPVSTKSTQPSYNDGSDQDESQK